MSPDPKAFYTERVPAQFNRTLRAKEYADPKAWESMRRVRACIRVDAEGSARGTFFLNIDRGEMAAGDVPIIEPFMALSHDAASFEVLERRSGDSILGFLAGIAGMADEIALTERRIESLVALNGTLRFELTGDEGFVLVGVFGEAERSSPRCVIRLDAETYDELRSGRLSSEDAFLGGRVEVEGDMQMAIELALAALSPD